MKEQRINKYNKYVVAEDFILISNYNTIMELPSFLRAVVNTTSKEYLTDKRQSISALAACFLVSGQRSKPTRAKRSIAAFKLREGVIIGCQTTLRKNNLHTFIDKLLLFALPLLYSEKGNSIPFGMTPSLSLNKGEKISIPKKEKNKDVSPFQREQSVLEQNCTKKTKALLKKKISEINALLNLLKEGGYKDVIIVLKTNSLKRLHNYALGIKDLLLMPELQEFGTLFESIRGMNLEISFSNPRLKGICLPPAFSFSKQRERGLLATTTCSTTCSDISSTTRSKSKREKENKRLSTIPSKSKNAEKSNSESYTHLIEGFIGEALEISNKDNLLRLEDRNEKEINKEGLPQKTMLSFYQEQGIKKKSARQPFPKPRDTLLSKTKRGIVFLTCFQYPKW